MENLKELLVEELKDLYSAEKQIVKALPKIIRGAASEELKTAIQEHLEVTKTQVTRLEEVFSHLGEKPKAKQIFYCVAFLRSGWICARKSSWWRAAGLRLESASWLSAAD